MVNNIHSVRSSIIQAKFHIMVDCDTMHALTKLGMAKLSGFFVCNIEVLSSFY